MNHNKINESGYNEAPKFGPSPNNPPIVKLSFRERCRLGNYTPFNIENLMGEKINERINERLKNMNNDNNSKTTDIPN